MTSYDELSNVSREQVEATMWLLKQHVFPGITERQERYLREHLSNCVQSCIVFSKEQKPHSRDAIRRIIEKYGYHATFEEHVNKAGNGVATTYVYAYFTRPSGSGKTARSLGKIEVIETMNEEAIAALIAKRFATATKGKEHSDVANA